MYHEFMEEHGARSAPHEAIFFVLAYLPVCELLAMSQVCKSLRHAINHDDHHHHILPWLRVVVGPPLNRRLTDDTLLKITSKAKGNLQLLALLNCLNITDDGLFTVVAQNPRINQLLVPNCSSLSPGGLIKAVKLLSGNNHALKSLRINGLPDIRQQDLETLRSLINLGPQDTRNKTLYSDRKKFSATLGHIATDCSIDVDMCPKCAKVRMVFECPRVSCPKKMQRELIECRGCESCIARCVECGICIPNDQELDEASCLDTLCLDCWIKLPKCDLCNKPSCNEHADLGGSVLGSKRFVCATCNAKFN